MATTLALGLSAAACGSGQPDGGRTAIPGVCVSGSPAGTSVTTPTAQARVVGVAHSSVTATQIEDFDLGHIVGPFGRCVSSALPSGTPGSEVVTVTLSSVATSDVIAAVENRLNDSGMFSSVTQQ
ncbi:MAG: hypothetical protein ACYDD4_05410 [Acidimicrobiales bacterium]